MRRLLNTATHLLVITSACLWVGSCGGGGGPANQAPNATLNATPLGGLAPVEVQCDASASSDPDGGALTFDWDMDGDGTFEVTGGTATPAPQTYNTAGNYTVNVRVSDSGGLADTATATITVYGGTWAVQTLDTGGVGEFCSLAVVAGRPAISYYDSTNQNLKFYRAGDASGTTWPNNSPMTVTSGPGDEGQFTSLAVVNGNPAISYYDATANSVQFIRADSTDGSSWGNAPVTVESGTVWHETSLSVVNGNPAIAFDTVSEGVMYERAGDADGTDWSAASRRVDGVDQVGGYASLAVVNGRPAVAFMRGEDLGGSLYYVQAGDAAGSGSWQTPVAVHASVGEWAVGQDPSLAVVNGSPAISYSVEVQLDVAQHMFVRSSDPDGAAGSWNAPEPRELYSRATIAAGPTSLVIIDGIPHIAFQSGMGGTLYHVRAADAEGSAWLQDEWVDLADDLGWYCSLADVNGSPGIAYYDADAGTLKYAVLQ